MIVTDFEAPDPNYGYTPHACLLLFRVWGSNTMQIARYFSKPEHEIVRALDAARLNCPTFHAQKGRVA